MLTERLTSWLEVAQLPSDATSSKIMSQLRHYFARWGVPEQTSTDGRTNLMSEEMTAFFKKWGIAVHFSSAHYPQSNGGAEAAVKSVKRMLMSNMGASLRNDSISHALLQYLNMPLHMASRSPQCSSTQTRNCVLVFLLSHRGCVLTSTAGEHYANVSDR
uniref:Integrase catalytic domain-containing protein n=1 Tax=Scylla olivacea TaxID=85551 RepID=A0A0P4W866_SCYOL